MVEISGLETDPTMDATLEELVELKKAFQSSIDAFFDIPRIIEMNDQSLMDLSFKPSLSLGTNMLAPPDEFVCPISEELMRDPVIVSTGTSCDRRSIQKLLDDGHQICPITKQVLSDVLTPNYLLRKFISRWCNEHEIELENPVQNANDEQNEAIGKQDYQNSLLLFSDQKDAAKELWKLTNWIASSWALNHESNRIGHRLPNSLLPWRPDTDIDLHPGPQEDLAMTVLNSGRTTFAEYSVALQWLKEFINSPIIKARCNVVIDSLTWTTPDSNWEIIGTDAIEAQLVVLKGENPADMKDVASTILSLCKVLKNREKVSHSVKPSFILKMIKESTLVNEFLAILALLSRVDFVVQDMLELGAVPLLVDIIRNNTSEKCKELSLAILYSLLSYARSGPWTQLIKPLPWRPDTDHDLNGDLQENLAMEVLNISTQNNATKLVAENLEATQLLIESMNSGSSETRCSAATDLLKLLTPDFDNHLIGSSGAIKGAIKLLLDILVESSPLPMKDVASAIFSLCSVVENREEIVHAGAVRVICKMIEKQPPPVEEFLAILALLSRVNSAAKEMLELEAVPLLLDIIRKDTPERCKAHSLEILYGICLYDMTVSRVLRDEQFKHETLSNVKGFGDHPLFLLCLMPTIPEDWQIHLLPYFRDEHFSLLTMSTASGSSSSKKITLKSSDGELFHVEEDVAMEFGPVKGFFRGAVPEAIPLPNVSSECLEKIIIYCTKHIEFRSKKAAAGDAGDIDKEIKEFNADFVKDEGKEGLIDLTLGANYLNIDYLLDFLYLTLADRISNKSVEYVRDFFNLENDFTPEEENEIRHQYWWAYEGVDQ